MMDWVTTHTTTFQYEAFDCSRADANDAVVLVVIGPLHNAEDIIVGK